MWRALMWLNNLYGRQAVRRKPKKGLKLPFFVFLALFWAYVRQPDGHIGWVILMPFASINPTNPRTNPWNFGGNCSAFVDVEKLSFFESAILNLKKKEKKMTYHTVLNRKSQLVLCVWPLDFDFNNRGAGHSRQFHSRFIFCILKKILFFYFSEFNHI